MREKKEKSIFLIFSEKVYSPLIHKKQMESWFALWQSQKMEQISRDVHEILILAQIKHQVTKDYVSILLTWVQELIKEVRNSIPFSQDFCEKYI